MVEVDYPDGNRDRIEELDRHEWRIWRHRTDHSVRYLTTKVGTGYILRDPNTAARMGLMSDIRFFEENYEEETSDESVEHARTIVRELSDRAAAHRDDAARKAARLSTVQSPPESTGRKRRNDRDIARES